MADDKLKTFDMFAISLNTPLRKKEYLELHIKIKDALEASIGVSGRIFPCNCSELLHFEPKEVNDD
tara:strand:+ start:107 stop:304 length:198 start_codon:yes stop_codon:yes gene_type:complete